MSDNKVYEMLWDCQYCGATKNLGLTHRFCPNCGAPQNPDSRYYPSDEDKIAVVDHKYVGADVICPSCSELNSAAAEFCGQCASPLTEGAIAKRLEAQARASDETFDSSGSRDIVKERFDAQFQPEPSTKPKNKPKTNRTAIFAVIGLVILGIIGAIVATTWTSEVELVVVDHEWERTINVQEYDDFRESSWRDSRPSGDSVSIVPGSCRREQRSTRRVADGETCQTVRTDNGDGTFSQREQCTTNYREEPVYDDMCTWEGFRWESASPIVTTGNYDSSPFWGATSFQCEGQSRIGCEREGQRVERYIVIYENTETGDRSQCTYSLGEWVEIEPDSEWRGRARVIGGGVVCDSLQPE